MCIRDRLTAHSERHSEVTVKCLRLAAVAEITDQYPIRCLALCHVDGDYRDLSPQLGDGRPHLLECLILVIPGRHQMEPIAPPVCLLHQLARLIDGQLQALSRCLLYTSPS